MEVITETIALISVDIHVIMIAIVLITVSFDTLDQHIINKVRSLCGLGDLSWLILQIELFHLVVLLLKLLKKALLCELLNAFEVLIYDALQELLEHHGEVLL